MKTQNDLLGPHHANPIFGIWLACNDVVVTRKKRHRSLTEVLPHTNQDLVNWLAERIVFHHYTEDRINRLKELYGKAGFYKYAEQYRKIPRADSTKKGNAAELILIEYIEFCKGNPLIKNYKFRYNPNVDQSIKGDDTLLIELYEDENKKAKIRMYLGESKFRSTPQPEAVNEISESLKKSKKPISYSFLVDQLLSIPETEEIGNILDGFIVDEIKKGGDIIYAGLLMSNSRTHDVVERTLDNSNPNLVFVSIGIDNPADLVNAAYEKAEEIIIKPNTI